MTKAQLGEIIAIVKTRRDELRNHQTVLAVQDRLAECDWFLTLLEKYYEKECICHPPDRVCVENEPL